MVIYIFRGIRSTYLCADDLWLFIYSEVLGALLSVLMIYGISAGLIYEATKRVKNPDSYELNPDVMLIVSCAGVFINVM